MSTAFLSRVTARRHGNGPLHVFETLTPEICAPCSICLRRCSLCLCPTYNDNLHTKLSLEMKARVRSTHTHTDFEFSPMTRFLSGTQVSRQSKSQSETMTSLPSV